SSPDQRSIAGPTAVETPSSALSPGIEEPNREHLETLAATWISDSRPDESPPGASSAIVQETVAMSQPGAPDLSSRRPYEETIPHGLDDAATGGRAGSATEVDSDADFVSGVAKA